MVDASNRSDFQDPNRIIDVSTFLSLNQTFKELERYMDSFGRSLTDNERRLKQTLYGMIKTFDKVESELKASGSDKLSKDQAADLKVMLNNDKLIMKWLNQLSQFNSAGLSKNSRNDKSFIQYATFFEKVLRIMGSSMEKAYRETDKYNKTIDAVRRKFGLVSSASASGKTTTASASVSKATKATKSSFVNPLGTTFFADLDRTFGGVPFVGRGTGGLKKISDSYKGGLSLKGTPEVGWFNNKMKSMNTRFKGITTRGPTGVAKGFHAPKAMYKYVPKTSRIASVGKGAGQALTKSVARIGMAATGAASAASAAIPILGAVLVGVGLIFKELKKHSPILQAVSSLFELAYTLFLMPIGNSLGKLFLPMAEALINLAIQFNSWWDENAQPVFDRLQSVLEPFFKGDFETALRNYITEWLVPNLMWLLDTFGELIFGPAWDVMKEVIQNLPETISGIISWFNGAVVPFFNQVVSVVTNIINTVQTVVGSIINVVQDPIQTISTVISTISEVITAIRTFFDNTLGPAVNAIKEAVSKVKTTTENVKKAVTDPINTAKSTTTNLVEKAGNALDKLNPHWFATGGVVTGPTLGIVGEAGPEAIIPLDEMGGIGATYVVNINGDVYGVSDLESRIERVIQRTANKSYFR